MNIHTDNYDEPRFQAGHFHIELIDGAWAIYDAYVNRVHLYFASYSEAIWAAESLAAAAEVSADALDAEYARLLPIARASMGAAE